MPIKIPASQNTASYQPSCTGPNHTFYVPNTRTFSGTTFYTTHGPSKALFARQHQPVPQYRTRVIRDPPPSLTAAARPASALLPKATNDLCAAAFTVASPHTRCRFHGSALL